MKHLYYFNWFTESPIAATCMDDLRKRDYSVEEVTLLTCDQALGSCWINPLWDPRLCKKCRFWKRGAFESLDQRVHKTTVDDILADASCAVDAQNLYQYRTKEDIRALEYMGVRIGWAALSVYISKTADTDPIIDENFRFIFDPILRSSIRLTGAADRLINRIKPDLITIFNGRTADTRPLLDLALRYQIELRGLENVVEAPHRYRVRIFRNCPPQDCEFHRNETLAVWNNSPRSDDEKRFIAHELFRGRRAGEGTRDVRSYIDSQQSGLLPDDWSKNRRNIVIFNSSENEIAGVPEAIEGSLFESQLEGIEFLLQHLPDDHSWVTLRVHPNLAGVRYAYHTALYELPNRYDRLTVIPATSHVSSYALMDNADLVVVFYSSTGVEASYWGKPVISLARPSYTGLNIVYEPQSRGDACALLQTPLPPKPRLGAIQWAYRIMAQEEFSHPVGLQSKYFKVGGKTIFTGHEHLTLLGSTVLFRVLSYVRFILPHRISPTKCLDQKFMQVLQNNPHS